MLSLLSKSITRKVPEVTVFFWVIKLATTAMGESTSDYTVYTFNPYVVVIVGFIAFLIALTLQVSVRKYIVWVYWLTVLMVAVFGTMAADVIHVVLGVPYLVSTVTFSAVLAVIFLLWRRSEHTLSIHSITTRKRELFYWATVLTTFALGTAAGDLFAYSAHLGFFTAGVVFVAIFTVPAIGYRLFKWNAVFAFWFAYILTRPIGASFADWTGKAKTFGALGLGDGPVAGVLAALIVGLVAYLTISRSDVDRLES